MPDTAEDIVRSWVANRHRAGLGRTGDTVWVEFEDIICRFRFSPDINPDHIEMLFMKAIEQIRLNAPGPGSLDNKIRFNPDEVRSA